MSPRPRRETRDPKPSPDHATCMLVPVLPDAWALVDLADLARVVTFEWRLASKGRYACIVGSNISLHQLVAFPPPGKIVDHVNGNGLDCRRMNLRVATRSQNQYNQRLSARSTSGFKGVCFHKGDRRWRATLHVNRKTVNLGSFATAEEAACAYDAAARKLYGPFACLNFPQPGEQAA